MSLDATGLARLSALLDEALDLDDDASQAWLARLSGADLELVPVLRDLLPRRVARETADLLQRGAAPLLAAADQALPGLGNAGASAHGLTPGDRVGPYRLVRELGSGGMGEVWLAERADGGLKRQVALKLPTLGRRRALLLQRFERERDILASLEHPNIARLYEAGLDEDGQPYLALEYVDGQPIDVWCRERAATVPERLRLLLQVAEAVAYAHGRLVLHRDLKPGNILVTAEGDVRLLDFGIAKLMEGDRAAETALTALSGRALTLDYASPEQIAGAPLGTASDVYSLGVVAFELLAGARPYRLKRGSAAELEEAIAGADAPRASDVAADPVHKRALRGDLDAILAKALRKRPEERYRSVAEFAEDLRRRREGEPVLARRESRLYRIGKFAVRHRLGVGATAAVLVALVTASAVSLWQARLAQRQAQRAQAVQAFLTDIFRANTDAQPDPEKARQTTARELLDVGAQRIEQHLRADPEGRAEVLGLLGDMYYDLGLDESSATFQGRRVAALKEAFGTRDARVARALVEQARQLDQLGRDDEQRRALADAEAILDALGDRDSAARAALLDVQGLVNLHDAPRAIALASASVQLYRSRHADDPNFPHALNRLGNVLWNSDRLAEAEPVLAESIDRLDRQGSASVSARLTALLTLAHIQGLQTRFVASEATYRRALALTVERNGETHVDTLHTQVRFAWMLHRTGRRAEAWRLMDAATATLAAGRHTPHVTRSVRTHLMQMLLAEARYEEAEPLVDWAVAQYRDVAGGRNPLLVACLRLQAEQRLGAGRLADAEAAVAEAQTLLSGLDAGQRGPVENPVHVVAARLALRRQQPAEALQALAQVAVRPGLPPDALQPELLRAQALRAEVLLALGETAAARAAAQQVLDRLAREPERDRFGLIEAEARWRLGLARQREGRRGEGCAALDAAFQLRAAARGERSVALGEIETARAGCEGLRAATR